MLLWLAITGCFRWEPDLLLTSIRPAEPSQGDETLEAGGSAILLGSGFTAETQVFVEAAGKRSSLDAKIEDHAIRVVLPMDAVGEVLVVARSDGQEAFLVAHVDTAVERPCSRSYTANTHVSLAEGVAVVDRFYPDGRRERIETPISLVVSVELLGSNDTRACSAILLKKSDGSFVVFESDFENPLKARARTLASFLQKELTEK